MNPAEWKRVTRAHPCPVCGKPDWCCITRDGTVVLCMRTESDHPCKGECGGWIHRLSSAGPVCRSVPSTIFAEKPDRIPSRSAEALLAEWRKNTLAITLSQFAKELGVTRKSLERLGCVWNGAQSCWAFPMRDETGKVVGIRLRRGGRKYSVTKSRAGLFFDPDIGPKRSEHRFAWLTEGPTDTAAVLSLDPQAVVFGRSDLLSGWNMLKKALALHGVTEVNICVDNELAIEGRTDSPGFSGNLRMAKALGLPCRFVQIPGFKDIRDYVKSGARLSELKSFLAFQKYTVVAP